MKNLFNLKNIPIFLFFLSVFFIVKIFTLFMPKQSSDWASWVQAFGSIGAIFVAIYVSYDQNKKQLVREKEKVKKEELSLLTIINDELFLLRKLVDERFADFLSKIPKNISDMELHKVPTKPFLVYEGSVSKIGIISDEDIRRKIIYIYSGYNRLFDGMSLFNEISDSYDDAKRYDDSADTSESRKEKDERYKDLEYSHLQLRELYKKIDDPLNALLRNLGEAIGGGAVCE
ncbi:hypothetical protein OVY01_20790 [Robbsia sp. Bb-Pol-6]|uniref:Uncharacterized protein n=1 Tax=Robbsia betulipollinis TaxID=2981849 RepID=A0ABT3ZT07_9BURK|nr:hypothetical protein [Robbsia betulipollinis]MCY0389587.1 hypothetical protein [Robbsia betulipollinis]